MKRNRVPNVETGENKKGRREQKATGCMRRRGEEGRGEQRKDEGKSRVSVERKRRCVRSADEELNGG